MSRAIVDNQRGSFDFAFSLMEKFIAVCPDEIWTRKFGGWPIWQQVYHALGAIAFFTAAPDAQQGPALVSPEVSGLKEQGTTPVSKADMTAFAALMRKAGDAYMDALTDADMEKKAEGASGRMGRETTNATIMALLVGHLLYHLGSCDAALRENGLTGVF